MIASAEISMPRMLSSRISIWLPTHIWESFTTSSCQNTLRAAQWVLLYEPTERETGQVSY